MSQIFPVPHSPRVSGPYTASAGQLQFAGTFPIQFDYDVVVTRTRDAAATTELVLDTDYEVAGVGSPAGFTVTLKEPALEDDMISLIGMADLSRTTSIVQAGQFNSRALDKELDRSRIIDQELRRDIATAADPLDRANKLAAWDNNGNRIAVPYTGTAPNITVISGYHAAAVTGTVNASVLAFDGLHTPVPDKTFITWESKGRNTITNPTVTVNGTSYPLVAQPGYNLAVSATGDVGTLLQGYFTGTSVVLVNGRPDAPDLPRYATMAEFEAQQLPASGGVNRVYIEGYYSIGDGGAGMWLSTGLGVPPTMQGWRAQTADGRYWRLDETFVNPLQVGAVGNGVTPDDQAIADWFLYLETFRAKGVLTRIHYLADDMTFDYTGGAYNEGLIIEGIKRNDCGFQMAPGARMQWLGGGFYHVWREFFVYGNVQLSSNGPLLQIGKDDFTDAFNTCIFDCIVVNSYNDVGAREDAETVRLNYFIFSKIGGAWNGGGSGNADAHPDTAPGFGHVAHFRQVRSCHGSVQIGNGYLGQLLDTGYSLNNNFDGFDIEECHIGIRTNAATVVRNEFYGDIIAKFLIDAIDGAGNVMGGNLSTYSGGSLYNGSNTKGFRIEQPQGPAQLVFTALPASGVRWDNNSGRTLQVILGGADLTAITLHKPNGAARGLPNVSGSGAYSIVLAHNDGITITRSGPTVGFAVEFID